MRTASELLMPGMRVGLFGGSFNPAHDGHRHVSLEALRRLTLDRVWWLVSPQNPLKEAAGMAPLDTRLATARAAADHPRICVSDIETRLATRYTRDTVHALTRRHPDVRFVWLMGADNMVQFPKWKGWREIANTLPIAVYPRPGHTLKARLSKTAQILAPHTLDATDAPLLAAMDAPALTFLEGPLHTASATAIRAQTDTSPALIDPPGTARTAIRFNETAMDR